MTGNNMVPTPSGTPQVIIWFKVYAGLLSVVYLLVAAVSIFFFVVDPSQMESTGSRDISEMELRIMGAIYLVLGLGLFIVTLISLLAPPRPWVWVYDLVIICFGMTSCCCLPLCIPMLIFWLKPETKQYFGRT